ncbi:methylation-associated defense system restriction endonuclease subunit S MAD5 [Emticicia sp. TH156]|uniref:methylation-associated defense system restriction endonuclease subunit S MAD5 n=1 Tax=Emticicia sp. TH156 TaxID=2067454 RepID=UPI000C76E479|nr:restriction endonuclease subunit S [Emticicia sp. TH156]PLK44982.1 hypothetical protein C0V77_06975 [Emticicia sp. TH156]
MKVLKTKSKWFSESDLRLDASFHLSEGRLAKLDISKCPYQIDSLGKLANRIFYGGRAKRIYVDNYEKGIPFMGSSDMLKSSLTGLKYISLKYTKNLDDFLLQKDWILVSRSGTVGNTVYTNDDFVGKAASEHIIRIVPNSKLYSGYLYAFLTSKYGYSLMTQGTFGAVIQHIEPDFLKNLPIPLLPEEKQKEIHQLIVDAAQLRVEANRLLDEADKLFLQLLNISDSELKELSSTKEKTVSNTFTFNFNALSPFTLRGRNYSPRKNRIIEILKSNKWDRLSEVLEYLPHYGARFKRIESNSINSVELLSQGDIFDLKPNGRRISTKNINNLEKEIVKKGTILIPAQGTLGENEIFGRAKLVWGYLEEKLVAGHALRFVTNETKIGCGYLYCVLSSGLWFRILRNTVYGTNLLGFIIELIKDYPIPRFSTNEEYLIDSKVKTAYQNLTNALQKETKAIQQIENEIASWQVS